MLPSRLILANLLCEEELAPRRRTPSRKVLQTVSGFATLLRVFARDGDRLWTPVPVPQEHIEPVAGLPMPVLVSGPVEPAEEVLAWGETPTAAMLRTAPRVPADGDLPLHELLWHLPVAPSSVVAAVSHRGFHLQVAEELGCALPGAQMVESMSRLERILASSQASAAWVVKAPFSAAGRSRYIERNGPGFSDPKARRTVERLLEVHGSLLFEPWMDRTADYGATALLASELKILGFHRQAVDGKGQFTGIDLSEDLAEAEREQLEETVEGVGRALQRAGYVGPFGVDAWRYQTPDGLAFHPMGEINPRMTFGLVARAARVSASTARWHRDTLSPRSRRWGPR